jgi:phage tail-like protein
MRLAMAASLTRPERRRLVTMLMIGAVVGVVMGSSIYAQGSPGGRGLASAPITANRAYVAGKFGIELDGVAAGWVYSAEGGTATADVVNERVSADHVIHKHLAGVKYEPITLTVGTGMSKGFYQWIKDTMDHKGTRKNGAIVAADYNYKEVSRISFTNALITEIGFPALDAASKDAAKMTIKIQPETTKRTVSTNGGSIQGTFRFDQSIQKKWLPANFRLKIDGLPDSTARVNKIEAIVVKQKVVENAVGQLRTYQIEPASLEIPNLVITTPESHSDDLYKWQDDFVIRGSSDKVKGGTLEYLTPDLQTVLFTITFKHLGIFKLTPEKVEAGSENVRRVKAEMYCEDMSFSYSGSFT